VSVLDITKLRHPSAAVKLLKLAAHIRAARFQLAHVFLADASLTAPFFCRLGGAQVIASRRDLGFLHTPAHQAALRVSNVFVTRIVTNSHAVKQSVHDRERYPLDRIDVVYNGHDPRRFDAAPQSGFRERLNIGPTDPIVGMVANLHAWKRHDDLLRAFALVRQRHPRAHLVLVGSGVREAFLKELVGALGIQSAVHWLGGVADVIPVVRHFTVGVLCSDSEGLSNAILEYMSCGKPSVCTNVGGNGELVTDGETGFLVDARDIDSLADRIDRVLAKPWLCESMGRRASDSARRFTGRRMADSHMELYDRLAGFPDVARVGVAAC
jgi:glycosyltransferase involved in cell wall biosynthesis